MSGGGGPQFNSAGIPDGTIVYADLANIAANSIIGNPTGAPAVPQAITATAAGLALLDDAAAGDQRTTLGLGTIATQAASGVAITGGSVTGITDLAVADGGTAGSTAQSARDNLGISGRGFKDWGIIGSSPITLRVLAGQASAAALGTATLAANVLYAVPFISPDRAATLDYVGMYAGIDVSTADYRFGVYAATSKTNFYPAANLSQSAKIDGPGAAGEISYAPALALTANTLYWIAVCTDTAITNGVRGMAVSGCVSLGYSGGIASGTAAMVGWSIGSQPDVTSNPLADPFPASAAAITAAPFPCIELHFSA